MCIPGIGASEILRGARKRTMPPDLGALIVESKREVYRVGGICGLIPKRTSKISPLIRARCFVLLRAINTSAIMDIFSRRKGKAS